MYQDSELNNLADQISTGDTNENSEQDIIKVIGVGGGGSNAISHMFRQGVEHVMFVVCNTDRQALKNSPVPTKVLIGNGLGAGNKPKVAEEAAEKDIEKIRALFQDNTKMVFITAGMGGGTGTGAAPIVAREAKARGLLTIGIVTIPFIFEGDKKINKALDGVDEMSKYVDALLVINNQRLVEIYGDLDFINAFAKADDTLSTAAQSISELITADGYMNLDFHDVDTTLRNGGAAIISTGFGEGENRVTMAIQDALQSPLLKNRDICTSKKLLFNLYINPKAEQKFTMNEMRDFDEFVSGISDVDVIWGVAYDESLGDRVKVTILASGFDITIRDEEKNMKSGGQNASRGRQQPFTPKSTGAVPPAADRIAREYGETRTAYIVLTPQQMDDDAVIEVLEKSPAYNRDRKILDNISAKQTPSAASTPQSGMQGHNGMEIKFTNE